MSWMDDEPARGGAMPREALLLAGIDRMQLGVERKMLPPPIYHLFGLMPVETGHGQSTFSMPASPWLQTGVGVFLAGVTALAADAPLGGAILSTVPAGVFGVTSELSMSYLRPAGIESRELIAHAQLIDAGRSVGLSQTVVEDANGRLLAHGTSRYFLMKMDVPATAPELPVVVAPEYDTLDPYLRPAPKLAPVEDWIDLSGIDIFRAVADGKLPRPPFEELFGITWSAIEEGSIELRLNASPWLGSPAATIYGGIIAMLADAVMTAAVATTLPARSSCGTLDTKVHYLRPGFPDGREIVARASVTHRGRSLAVAGAEIINADGKRLATATGSWMVLEGKPWAPVAVADEQTREDP